MKIVHTPPPNYKEIREHFPDADYEKGVLFTYGDTCYCKEITPDLIAHEETHTRQQNNPEEWWARYFIDPVFRFEQEAEAYRNQYVFLQKTIKNRSKLFRYLHQIATVLSGKLYGNCASYSEALKKVKYGS